LIPLTVVGGIELGLRLFGFGYPTSFLLKTTISGQDYFVPNDKFGYRFFPPALARTPAPQRLPVKKSPQAFRIFVFGESAAMGDPDSSYGAWRYLRTLLSERYPGTDFEVICLAMTAINSHAILPMARECARREGDLWIVYMGNNEMVGPLGAGDEAGSRTPGTSLVRTELAIKTTRIGQLLDGLRQRWSVRSPPPETWGGLNMFDHHLLRPEDANRLRAYENFKENLTDIVRAGQAAGVPIILSTVGSNLKDCAPFASLHATNLSETQKGQWDGAYQRGLAFESAGDYENALKQFAGAAAIDPQYAELQFRLGSCHLALTNFAQARREFELARDDDALAFRADGRINQIIKAAAEANAGKGVHFLDVERVLAASTPGKIPGDELFYEHVHLNFDGNYLLGRAWAEQTAGLLPQTIVSHDQGGWVSSDICDRRLAVSSWDRSRVFQEILSRMAEPLYARQLTHDATVRLCREKQEELATRMASEAPDHTRQLYQQALALAPADNFLHQNFAQYLGAKGELAQATVEAQHVCELLPQRPAQDYDIGNLLIIQGRVDEAAEYYSRALALQRDFAPALNGLGQIRANQQKTAEAAAYFRKALRANPKNPETCFLLGFLAQAGGDLKQAALYYQQAARLQPGGVADFFSQAVGASLMGLRGQAMDALGMAIQLNPGCWQARYLLGLELVSDGKIEEARRQLLAAVRYRPDFAPAHLNLGIVLAKQDKTDPALAEFRAALQIDPANAAARQYVATLRPSKRQNHEGDSK
jgi:tetratricopeptide (TPR) repeat protein